MSRTYKVDADCQGNSAESVAEWLARAIKRGLGEPKGIPRSARIVSAEMIFVEKRVPEDSNYRMLLYAHDGQMYIVTRPYGGAWKL